MSWFDVLKFQVPRNLYYTRREIQEADAQKRIANRRLRPNYNPETNTFSPEQNQKWQEMSDKATQRVEAVAQKWKQYFEQLKIDRKILQEEYDKIIAELDNYRNKVKDILEAIKAERGVRDEAKRKIEEAKVALKQYPMLGGLLDHLESVENMADFKEEL